MVAFGLTLLLGRFAGVSMAYSMGLFAGALTSTPTLQAAIDAAGNRDPAIGYSVAYPFGVIGPILCLFVFSRLCQPRMAPAPAPLQHVELTLEHPPGNTVGDVLDALPHGVELVALRQGDSNTLPHNVASPVAAGDTLLLLGNPEALEAARSRFGREASGQIVRDRSQLDIVRTYVSRPAMIGVRLSDVTFPQGVEARIAEVRRGDLLLLPRAELVLEWGDRVGVITSRDSLPAIRRLFGDSIKSTTEFSYVSVGLGMSLGVLLGLLAIPLPGLGSFSLGLAGGPLVVALILGRLGRVGSFSWQIPLAANLTLRNFGLTLFLAAVGLDSGAPFMETVSRTGFTLLGIGMAIVIAAMAGILLIGQLARGFNTDDLYGIASGAAGNPAILVYANRALSSDRIDVAYAMIFPSMTILKILCVQVGIGALTGG
jgi:putative transport protein